MPSISAVIPAFNEEAAIRTTVEGVARALREVGADFEVVVVDDGSRDRTASVVLGLRETLPMVRLVQHETNRGYGAALGTGFAAAEKELLFLTDGDTQFDPREIAKLLPRLEHADLAIGYRKPRRDPWQRRFFGWGWNTLINLLFGYTARDVDCAFKLFPRALLRELNVTSEAHTFSPELIVKARRAGYRIAEVRVTHLPRRVGEAKGSRPDAIARSLIELLRFRLALARSDGARHAVRAGGAHPES
jgi:glycosyltransferase involved in cell wall biosynthesis